MRRRKGEFKFAVQLQAGPDGPGTLVITTPTGNLAHVPLVGAEVCVLRHYRQHQLADMQRNNVAPEDVGRRGLGVLAGLLFASENSISKCVSKLVLKIARCAGEQLGAEARRMPEVISRVRQRGHRLCVALAFDELGAKPQAPSSPRPRRSAVSSYYGAIAARVHGQAAWLAS